MEYTPLTPFRRAIDAVPADLVAAPTPLPAPVEKWPLLGELTTARAEFGLSDRDLTVLRALLSFYPGQRLAAGPELIVFPSNRTLCERLNGMPCSTMRRHLARLVGTGLIGRRDSPNGKRYLRRRGPERTAFGFDLAPLLRQAEAISAAAEAERAATARRRALRETLGLMRRDLAGLAALGEARAPGASLWGMAVEMSETSARMLRRKLSVESLIDMIERMAGMLERIKAHFSPPEAAVSSTSLAQNEQRQQKTEEKNLIEGATKPDGGWHDERPSPIAPHPRRAEEAERRRIALPASVAETLRACPEIRNFSLTEIRSWRDLIEAARAVAPMMGIPSAAMAEAEQIMGPPATGVAIAAMLQRFTGIRSPAAYLRALSERSKTGRLNLRLSARPEDA